MNIIQKGSVLLITSLLLAASSISGPIIAAHAAAVNLITNPSLELANAGGTAPLNWQTDKWGTNTATFQYKNTGNQSNHSAYVSVSGYKSGDAKWFFDPVAVSASTSYTFSESYQSSIKTHLVAMSLNASNVASYFDIDVNVPASATWKNLTYNVKTLAGTKKLTILHLVEGNGWLQTDNFSLSLPGGTTPTPPPVTPPTPPPVTPPAVPGVVDHVPNNSVEGVSAANTTLPTDWSHSSWGTNKPTYQYIKNDGHDGSDSVKVTMASYTDGDAKWVYTPQALTRGADYRFTGWYKTNTVPHVVAQYIKDDGSEDYFGLPDPEPAANAATTWQKYSDVFSVPQGVKSVSLFFFVSNNGWVQTDDYHVTPYQYTGFNRGLVTLTFDDGFEENVTTALPTLDKYNFKATECFATQYVEGLPDEVAITKKLADDGQEICSHSVTHPWLSQIPTAQVDYELQHSQQFLQSITGQPITNFASPYGDYNASVNAELAKFYKSHRTTDEGFNSKDNFNPYRLRVQNMQTTTTLAQVQSWVNKAKVDHTWLVLVYHVIGTNKADLEQFDTYKPDFDTQMAWLAQNGITVERWDQALNEVSTQ
ncbi:MAG TPA: polysaccharide deacetylase family protein [Patescibacteria group bacterium]|nr:polysaccharide deacetylase family protein [Patescibacteria group bacterium]